MNRNFLFCLYAAIAITCPVMAQEQEPEQVLVRPFTGESKVRMRHEMDTQGMIMNENRDQLPAGCREISEDVEITVHAGRKYAGRFPGTMFTYDQQEWNVKPCARITVKFVNEDDIRHQFMIHGLPEYLYPPTGMFHIELNGPGSKTAAFIVPSEAKTFLVHCEIAQHMEKGMKAQLKVGDGDGDIPNIPGLTEAGNANVYAIPWSGSNGLLLVLAALSGIALAVVGGLYFKNQFNLRGLQTEKGKGK
ncbi:MAG: cupredoxin domain-containing protein [Methylococcaceae bacterium]|nr:cupredoxin domain-containing protein [Methylococcaceae bacterium]